MRFMQSCPEARATQDGHRGRELNHALQHELFGQAYPAPPAPARARPPETWRVRGPAPARLQPPLVADTTGRVSVAGGMPRAPVPCHPAAIPPLLTLPYPRATQQPLHSLGQQLEAVEACNAAEHREAGRVRGRRLRARQRAAALVAAAPQVAAAHLRAPAPAHHHAAERPHGIHLRAVRRPHMPCWRAHASRQRVRESTGAITHL